MIKSVNLRLWTLIIIFFSPKFESYPKSTKIDTFEQKKCHNANIYHRSIP